MHPTDANCRSANTARPTAHMYRVTILYREPTYERRVGSKAEPYRFTYAITAVGADQARTVALDEFRYLAALSGSGWIREVVDIVVRLQGPQ